MIRHGDSLPEIGGYFGLDMPEHGEVYPEAIRYQSGRAAMRAALECNGMTRVFMPSYICDSIIRAAQNARLEVELYDIDASLYPVGLPDEFPHDCALVYVNYFGLCRNNILRLLDEVPAGNLIIDNSHALFDKPTQALATIYSPRKFVGLPDGGLLMASPQLRITPPGEEDDGSIGRMKYLLVRMAYSARQGYADFDAARNSLHDLPPMAMSRLTQRLMKSIAWDDVVKRRRENFMAMAAMMDHVNQLHWSLGENDVPLCYPLLLKEREASAIKAKLTAYNVFTATYWPDVLPRAKPGTMEARLLDHTLFLPIDQRMDTGQVEDVGRLVLDLASMGHPIPSKEACLP